MKEERDLRYTNEGSICGEEGDNGVAEIKAVEK